MNWSIDFSPMLPAPFFWALALRRLPCWSLLLFRRSRGALLRALSLAALLLALANPTLRAGGAREPRQHRHRRRRREPEPDDRRPARADRGHQAELEAKLGRIANLQVRWVTSSQADRRDRRPAPTSSPTSTARWPTPRPTGSPASSWSPTARCTTCRSRRRRSASTRPCTRC